MIWQQGSQVRSYYDLVSINGILADIRSGHEYPDAI